MTTEELLRVINNSSIKTVTEFIDLAPKMFNGVSNITINNKTDLGISGTIVCAEFNYNTDRILVKGLLYPNDLWSEETIGYVIAKKI